MTVVVLDPRWPNQIPLEAIGRITAPVEFSSEVPVSVRWNFDGVVAVGEQQGSGTLVTTELDSPEVRARRDAGEKVIVAASLSDPLFEAQVVMARANRIGEWEASQTHTSLLPYLEEEAYEFAEAVRDGASDPELLSELGDVFLQVLFHAEIASRRGAFDMGDVAGSFVKKMRSRSPYLFDGTESVVSVEEQERFWAEGKAKEARAKSNKE